MISKVWTKGERAYNPVYSRIHKFDEFVISQYLHLLPNFSVNMIVLGMQLLQNLSEIVYSLKGDLFIWFKIKRTKYHN